MSTEAIRSTIATLIHTQLSAAEPGLAIAFENQPFTQPRNAPWVHVAIIPNMTRRESIGADRRFRRYGVVNIQIHVPENSGTLRLREIADSIETILLDRQLTIPDGLGQLTLCYTKASSRGTLNGWYVGTVTAEYHAHVVIDR